MRHVPIDGLAGVGLSVSAEAHRNVAEIRERLNAAPKPAGFPHTKKTPKRKAKPRDISMANVVALATSVLLDMLDDGRFTRTELLAYFKTLRETDPLAADERDWNAIQRKVVGPSKRPLDLP